MELVTCLVAWRSKSKTLVGADGVWVAGAQKGGMKDEKVFKHGRFVIALAGGMRAVQVIRHSTPTFNPDTPDSEIMPHLISEWVPELQKRLSDTGQLIKDDDKAIQMLACGLIVSRKLILRLGTDFSIVEERLPYAAGGSGEELALGYLQACREMWGADEDMGHSIVMGALGAASMHNNTVGPPYKILEAGK